MGISIGFSEDAGNKNLVRNSGTPDPKRFKILQIIKLNNFYLIKVHYPDCINYDGIKILIIQYDGNISDLKFLDPHFLAYEINPKVLARFEPTDLGWESGKNCLFNFI